MDTASHNFVAYRSWFAIVIGSWFSAHVYVQMLHHPGLAVTRGSDQSTWTAIATQLAQRMRLHKLGSNPSVMPVSDAGLPDNSSMARQMGCRFVRALPKKAFLRIADYGITFFLSIGSVARGI